MRQLQICIPAWWMTLGDLLAIQRGRAMPMVWEHDIDICITPEEFPRFEKALTSRTGYFEPKRIHYGKGHWYIPIDMAKLGLRAREAEGVNIDVWRCPKSFKGNITRVLYCNGYVNVPGSALDRHMLLTKEYGDYCLVACVAALVESRACTKPPALPYLLVFSEDEKSDWFKMKKYANLC